ncbi:WEB family protein At2g38370 isoform X2 [Hordeum vulgare subsp. vulgare]|uniref:WEB family protein At2g38370 isoform X2 n=1 Tax=Hordeum vulgare subsp. vulgare TaxID=112509 RepID=UPI001D1A5771|nr:WEB family protein At2g38370 isoform X2 [Hordeum vulgare subsp. vulgare]
MEEEARPPLLPVRVPVNGEDLAPAAGACGVGGGRAEIDTSAPFESVREAVDRFGGSAAWSSHLVNRIFAHHKKQDRSVGAEDAQRVSLAEQTAQIEKELGAKERETLDVLKQLESAKKIIAGLKLKIQKKTAEDTLQPEEDKRQTESNCSLTEVSAAEPDVKQPEGNAEAPEEEQTAEVKQPEGNAEAAGVETAGTGVKQRPEGNAGADVDMLDEQQHPNLVLMELEQAKSNLNRTTGDLAAIRASIESLRNDIATEKVLVERSREKVSSDATLVSSLELELDQTTQKLQTLKDLQRRREDPSDVFFEIKKMTSEIEQLRNAANASKSEAMMLAAEIEQTKATIGTAEIRCLAAKKMEEAARAAEALALAEIKALLCTESSAGDLQGVDGVSLSVEEYSELALKAQEADESSRNKIAAAMVHVDEANQSKSESLTRLEEAKMEVEECKKALQEALKRVETANRRKFAVEETLRRCRSETGHKRRSFCGSPKFKTAAHRHKHDSHCMDIIDVSDNSMKPTLSIGQILSMKLMGPDGYDKSVSDDTSETSSVSLGQILNRRQAIVYSSDTSANKKFSGKRKKFAFTGLSVFLAKQAKSKKKRGSDEN